MSEPIELVIGALNRGGCDPRPSGPDAWESQCPLHQGSRHNLNVSRGDDGRALLHCHHVNESGGSCSHAGIVAALGLSVSDLFPKAEGGTSAGPRPKAPPNDRKKQGKTYRTSQDAIEALYRAMGASSSKAWVYQKADGSTSMIVSRFDFAPPKGKEYRPIHQTPEGWKIGDPPGPLPLFDLPKLAGAARVYVTEGEKAARLAESLGLVATTSAHGAQSPHKTDWSPLAGLEVVILPDADVAGEGYAKGVMALLSKLAPKPIIRMVRLPDLPEGGDIVEWRGGLPAGMTDADAVAALAKLADAAPVEDLTPPADADPQPTGLPRLESGTWVMALDRGNYGRIVEDFGDRCSVLFQNDRGHSATVTLRRSELVVLRGEPSGVETSGPEALEWPDEPRQIRVELLSVPAMHELLTPEPLRPWLTDIAERVSCPLDYPVIGALTALSSLVGRQFAIRPKQRDDWTVVPSLWGAIIGRPGMMKTPALKEAMKPLNRLAKEANDLHNLELGEYECQTLVAKAQADVAKEALKKAAKGLHPQEELADLARRATLSEINAPTWRRYQVNDTTVEKLGEILRDNPNGVQMFRDELTGWLKNFDKPGREADRAFFLEAWDGNGSSFTYDRIGRGTIIIPNPCVGVLGGIQPGPLRKYLKAVASGSEADDGLISRLQMMAWPDSQDDWRNVDRFPDSAARDRGFAVFRAVAMLDATGLGATVDTEGGIPFVRFALEAQEMFNAWREELENGKIRAEGESPLMESHLSKYRSLFPSLALLFHVVNMVDGLATGGPVPLAAAEVAAAWCDYLEAHARRVYGSIGEADKGPAQALLGRIKAGELPSPFAARDVYRKGWTGLGTKEEVDRALVVLEDHGWARALEVRNTGGAPRIEVHIHPRVVASWGPR